MGSACVLCENGQIVKHNEIIHFHYESGGIDYCSQGR